MLAIAADEREHAEIWKRLADGSPIPAAAGDAAASPVARSPDAVGRDERWHRTGRSGTLRAVIFGVSDGLVSNTSLVMGVAGASSGESRFILLAGIAGLLAGAFSMAAGEYISMQSQRELYERQIALERAELEAMPEEEQAELAAVYREKGFTATRPRRSPSGCSPTRSTRSIRWSARSSGSTRMSSARRGGRPVGRSSPSPSAPPSRSSRSCSAPARGLVVSLALSLSAMFAVGVGVSLLTGRGAIFSGLRQVAIGAAAAIVTFLVGRLIGVTVA